MNSIIEAITTVLYACNCLLGVCGLTLLIFGIVLLLKESRYVNIFDSIFLSVGSWSLCIGFLLLVVVAFGINALIKKKTCCLFRYAMLLIVVFLSQISLGLFAAVTLHPANNFTQRVQQRFEVPFKRNNSEFRTILNKVERNFKCCGIKGSTDYNTTVPKTCCENNCKRYHESGCVVTYAKDIEKHIKEIAYISLVFSLPHIGASCLSLILRKSYIRCFPQDTPHTP
ncbi:23 kDa integral membrane protein isoform X2 [Tribolium castaneum]|uniref:CD63 antigen-like Protein n=1 Tax=Tribolium castaneum TaxID=7070 RepID=A0A139WBD4_TRICA|nr:PREDICTED: 23 kDa integral membrane protein-like [Tribolium castaneum]KYB25203.1 CD63 antigen-like Protein [Tribolium castaneum]|eukprot:XP_015839068.1 PREDICTED: 23 kDa integral membrane protein-like [Tribolium castaneum]